jgi:hypothetical protein
MVMVMVMMVMMTMQVTQILGHLPAVNDELQRLFMEYSARSSSC